MTNLRDDLTRMAEKVRIWIPIYEDTSKDDVNWEEIAGLQNLFYGEKKRQGNYVMKLRIWDLMTQVQNYTETGRRLGLSRSTVQEIHKSVFKDIMGTSLKGKLREKRVAGVNPRSHFAECPQCSKANNADQYCSIGRNLSEKDDGAQRELTIGKEPEDFSRPSWTNEFDGTIVPIRRRKQGTRNADDQNYSPAQHVGALLRDLHKCPQCKRTFLGLYPLKSCKDHAGETPL
jgi:glutaredoxin